MVGIGKSALMITGCVTVMMLVVEYLNVLTRGAWQERLADHVWGQYFLAALLGATPGCLGAFAIVAMYTHRVLTLGAVVSAMIATSGDEAFVLLAMLPRTGMILTLLLPAIGILAGALTDLLTGWRRTSQPDSCDGFEIHEETECLCFSRDQVVDQWRRCTAARGALSGVLALFLAAIVSGEIGPPGWTWVRVTLSVATAAALIIVGTVPDHFLEEHLWQHVVVKHVPHILLWTLGALVVVEILTVQSDPSDVFQGSKWVLLASACLIGLVPESGPHLVLVALYARGAVPFSILFANSIVQDGHGMLPVLAHSRHDFLVIKTINLVAGLLFGAVAIMMGL